MFSGSSCRAASQVGLSPFKSLSEVSSAAQSRNSAFARTFHMQFVDLIFRLRNGLMRGFLISRSIAIEVGQVQPKL